MVNKQTEKPLEIDYSQSIGLIIKSAREQQKLTFKQVSSRINIHERYLSAIENDDFSSLGYITRARGFIKSYARYLGLDEDQILAKHKNLFPSEQINSLHVRTEPLSQRVDKSPLKKYVYLGSGFVLLIIATWLFYSMRFNSLKPEQKVVEVAGEVQSNEVNLPPPAPEPEPIKQNEVPPNKVKVDIPTVSPVVPSTPPAQVAKPAANETKVDATKQAQLAPKESSVGLPSVTNPSSAVKSEAPKSVKKSDTSSGDSKIVPDSQVSIKFLVNESAWVEVKDSTGQHSMNKLISPGVEEVFHGTPPFKVHVGNAKGTQIIFNGQPVDFSANVHDNTARIMVGEE
jgi:cytoskeleton protein RodZ